MTLEVAAGIILAYIPLLIIRAGNKLLNSENLGWFGSLFSLVLILAGVFIGIIILFSGLDS